MAEVVRCAVDDYLDDDPDPDPALPVTVGASPGWTISGSSTSGWTPPYVSGSAAMRKAVSSLTAWPSVAASERSRLARATSS